ncbi:MAG: PilZ domain-containing protein [Thermodesulfobacteriota bacterium]|nr:PilZ domain-containing protein [Thermodesulfobacteriota bacterium]
MESLKHRSERRNAISLPAKVFIIDQNWIESGSPNKYNAHIRDLSVGGMCLHLKDVHDTLNSDDLLGKKIKIQVNIPEMNQSVFFFGEICWGRCEKQNERMVIIGVQFVEISDSHLKYIEKLSAICQEEHKTRRREKRHKVSHPIKIHVVNPGWVKSGRPTKYRGFAENLSPGGMCIYIHEGYNPLNIDDLIGKRIKIEMTLPSIHDRIYLLGEVRWGTRKGQGAHVVMIGVQFVEMTDFHSKGIEQFLTINAKDHSMLWDLWDNLMVNG